MKAQELRIGNKLQKSNGEIFTVLRLDNTKDVLVCEERGLLTLGYNLIGIPLTEEWLLRFGFEVNYCDDRSHYYTKELKDDKYCDLSFIQGDKNGYLEVCLFPYETFFRYRYVHQIQNIYFALTGEELTIKELKEQG